MIVEWFIQLGTGFVSFFVGLLPDSDWSDGFVVSATNAVSSLMVAAGQISAWFPFPEVTVALVALVAWYVALLGVKIIRWLWGLTPFSGGS